MTVYLDLIFLENIFMNTIIIYATAIILKKKIIITRIICGSAIGSIYACIYYTSNLEVYSSIILKIILSIVIVYVSFNAESYKNILKELLIFYLTSFTFGGVTFALLYFVSPTSIIFQNGVLAGMYPLKTILIGGLVGFLVIIISFKTIKNRISKNDMVCAVCVEIKNRKVNLKAVIDTGNFLREPITGCPVVIVEKEKIQEIISANFLNNIQNILNGKLKVEEKYLSKIKLIPFTALGTDNGLLLGIKPDKFTINYQGKNIQHNNVIIGIYEKKLSKNGKYNALVGLDIIDK